MMPTRQQIQIGLDLVNKTSLANNLMFEVENTLYGTVVGVGTVGEIKDKSVQIIDATLDICQQVGTILVRVDESFVDNGLLAVQGSRADLLVDTTQSAAICNQEKPNILLAASKPGLKTIGDSFRAYQPKVNIKIRPDTVLSQEQIHLNIVNNILDAMSWELKGYNSHNGQLSKLSEDGTKILISKRINDIVNSYLPKLPSSPEKDLMKSVTLYVYQNLDKLPLIDLAGYIDLNISKLILVRCAWGL